VRLRFVLRGETMASHPQWTPNGRACRKASTGLVIVLSVGAWSLGPAFSAGAAGAHHWIAGRYQEYAPAISSSPVTTVLCADRTTTCSASSVPWSVQKQIVTTRAVSAAPTIVCVEAGQPPQCDFTSVTIGRVTPQGIASPAAPGTANIYVGSDPVPLLSSPFWAVRTGRV
jgi:hypothetical protein